MMMILGGKPPSVLGIFRFGINSRLSQDIYPQNDSKIGYTASDLRYKTNNNTQRTMFWSSSSFHLITKQNKYNIWKGENLKSDLLNSYFTHFTKHQLRALHSTTVLNEKSNNTNNNTNNNKINNQVKTNSGEGEIYTNQLDKMKIIHKLADLQTDLKEVIAELKQYEEVFQKTHQKFQTHKRSGWIEEVPWEHIVERLLIENREIGTCFIRVLEKYGNSSENFTFQEGPLASFFHAYFIIRKRLPSSTNHHQSALRSSTSSSSLNNRDNEDMKVGGEGLDDDFGNEYEENEEIDTTSLFTKFGFEEKEGGEETNNNNNNNNKKFNIDIGNKSPNSNSNNNKTRKIKVNIPNNYEYEYTFNINNETLNASKQTTEKEKAEINKAIEAFRSLEQQLPPRILFSTQQLTTIKVYEKYLRYLIAQNEIEQVESITEKLIFFFSKRKDELQNIFSILITTYQRLQLQEKFDKVWSLMTATRVKFTTNQYNQLLERCESTTDRLYYFDQMLKRSIFPNSKTFQILLGSMQSNFQASSTFVEEIMGKFSSQLTVEQLQHLLSSFPISSPLHLTEVISIFVKYLSLRRVRPSLPHFLVVFQIIDKNIDLLSPSSSSSSSAKLTNNNKKKTSTQKQRRGPVLTPRSSSSRSASSSSFSSSSSLSSNRRHRSSLNNELFEEMIRDDDDYNENNNEEDKIDRSDDSGDEIQKQQIEIRNEALLLMIDQLIGYFWVFSSSSLNLSFPSFTTHNDDNNNNKHNDDINNNNDDVSLRSDIATLRDEFKSNQTTIKGFSISDSENDHHQNKKIDIGGKEEKRENEAEEATFVGDLCALFIRKFELILQPAFHISVAALLHSFAEFFDLSRQILRSSSKKCDNDVLLTSSSSLSSSEIRRVVFTTAGAIFDKIRSANLISASSTEKLMSYLKKEIHSLYATQRSDDNNNNNDLPPEIYPTIIRYMIYTEDVNSSSSSSSSSSSYFRIFTELENAINRDQQQQGRDNNNNEGDSKDERKHRMIESGEYENVYYLASTHLCRQHLNVEVALKLLKQMQKRGVKPHPSHYYSLFNMSIYLNNLKMAETLLNEHSSDVFPANVVYYCYWKLLLYYQENMMEDDANRLKKLLNTMKYAKESKEEGCSLEEIDELLKINQHPKPHLSFVDIEKQKMNDVFRKSFF